MKKFLVEFIGTFFLTLTIGLVIVYGSDSAGGTHAFAPFAIGTILMAVTYAGAHVSGAHFNPAVTLGMYIRGRIAYRDIGPYVISHFLAAIVGGVAAGIITGKSTTAMAGLDSTSSVLLAEFLFTFALVFIFLNCTTISASAGNSHYGLAIGGTVAVGTLAVGSISLGGFNPAVSLMFAMTGKLGWADIWMHFLPQILGGLSGGFAFKAVCPEEK